MTDANLATRSPPEEPVAPPRAVGEARYLPTLDGWRAVAISFVVLAHAADGLVRLAGKVGLSLPRDAIRESGLLGVQIFFGLSGFLITSRLIDEENRRGRINLRSFYIRRAFRILPAAMLFLVAVGALALAGVLPITVGRWLSCLLCFANYSWANGNWYVGHFWSLAVEEHFYFLWPTAFLLLATIRRRAMAAAAMAIALALWRAVDFKYQITGQASEQFWGRTDIQGEGLLLGVTVALLAADPVWKVRLRRWLTPWPVWLSLALLVLFLDGFKPADYKLRLLLFSVKAAAIPLVLLGTVLMPQRPVARLLESAPLRWLGRLSYSLYLWQQLFCVWDENRVTALGILQDFPLNLVGALGFAALSHFLVEKPLINLGHRLAKRGGTPPAAG